MSLEIWFIISTIYIVVLFVKNCSLTFRCAYYKQKLINRDVDISSVDSFWSFLK